MLNGIQKIEAVIDYIESNITADLDYNLMAQKMNLSVYEFRRIFSFVVGCSLSEYIRKRKLSLAALEIIASDKVDILKISEKYGYSNQSAFTRAFSEQHGIFPTAYAKEKNEINLFTRPKFELSVHGGKDVPLKIIENPEYYIAGFSAVSGISDTCCCEDVWSAFYKSGAGNAFYTDKIYVSYENQGANVRCTIGQRIESAAEGMHLAKIPKSRFACFKMNTVDDDVVNEKYSNILYEWLPSANLKRNEKVSIIEVFPFDMSENGFEWEIRIPIE